MNDSYAMQAPTGFGDDFLLGRVGAEREFYATGGLAMELDDTSFERRFSTSTATRINS